MTSKGDGERSQKQRMIAGELYRADDPELVASMRNAELLIERFNGTSAVNAALRAAILKELLGEPTDSAVLKAPFRCHYGFNTSARAPICHLAWQEPLRRITMTGDLRRHPPRCARHRRCRCRHCATSPLEPKLPPSV